MRRSLWIRSPAGPRAALPVLLATTLAGAGCSASVPIEATFPAPVVETLPLSVGVYYDDTFRNYRYEEELSDGKNWSITLGGSNVELFNQLFSTLFAQVTEVDGVEGADATLDAILHPSIDEYAFLLPRESGLDFYSVSIRYLMELYSADGRLLASWPVNSYGKSRSRTLKGKESLKEATLLAMRDASAALAVELKDQPQILQLLTDKGADHEQNSEQEAAHLR